MGPICETGDFLGKDRELAHRTGRSAGGALRRRLRFRHEFQLQFPAARRRGDGGRRPVSGGAPAGDGGGVVCWRGDPGVKVEIL
ncbi:MAG: hypothetical protein MZV65_20170 [Chromatiales bacterium]|nr:hypothetical protein [Chromatiales bacterium]